MQDSKPMAKTRSKTKQQQQNKATLSAIKELITKESKRLHTA
jgi:hypothetical protein